MIDVALQSSEPVALTLFVSMCHQGQRNASFGMESFKIEVQYRLSGNMLMIACVCTAVTLAAAAFAAAAATLYWAWPGFVRHQRRYMPVLQGVQTLMSLQVVIVAVMAIFASDLGGELSQDSWADLGRQSVAVAAAGRALCLGAAACMASVLANGFPALVYSPY